MMFPATDTIPIPSTIPASSLEPRAPSSEPPASSPEVQCVDTLWGFPLRHTWNQLLRASAADSPFLTWEWLYTWWTHVHGSAGLQLLTVRAGDEIMALAPLRVSRGALPCFSRLEFLGTGHAGSDYLDLIARRGCEAESIEAVGEYLRSRKLALRLDHVPSESLASSLAQYLAGHGWTASTAPGGVCPVIRLAGHSWDSYLATLGSSHRANVRRRTKGLANRFEMRFERVTLDSERREALAALIAFHGNRWRDERGSTTFVTPALRAFHDEATRRALERGWLRLYTLRLNGAIAAVMYGFHYNGRFYFYQHGFDEQYKPHSVGLVLMGLTIRAAIEEGADEFDMLWGVEPYKFLWAQDRRLLQQIHLFPPHVGGRIHQRAVVARHGLSRLARRVFSSTGDPCAA
jgi:CelD/BcsL family acetyltransferase involved in cellulose biosynthesis